MLRPGQPTRAAGLFPAFVCPRCRAPLTEAADAYRCQDCGSVYPVALGIADFRVFPDPWIGMTDDRDKGRRLAAQTADQDFAATVRAYWDMTPDTPRPWANRFTERVLAAEERGEDWVAWMADADKVESGDLWLDIGCGTADLAAAVTRRGGIFVGVDIAFRWLVVARKRPALGGNRALVVCANAEHLPFADGTFDRVVTSGTLEHCADAAVVAAEGHRVLRSDGAMRIRTVNRYSILREPHVGLWGVGLVPRRWADALVRWRSGQRYLHHRPLSPRELARDLRRAGFTVAPITGAPLLAADRRRLRGVLAWAGRMYDVIRATPVLGTGLAWVAPEIEARAVADRRHVPSPRRRDT